MFYCIYDTKSLIHWSKDRSVETQYDQSCPNTRHHLLIIVMIWPFCWLLLLDIFYCLTVLLLGTCYYWAPFCWLLLDTFSSIFIIGHLFYWLLFLLDAFSLIITIRHFLLIFIIGHPFIIVIGHLFIAYYYWTPIHWLLLDTLLFIISIVWCIAVR